MKTYRNKCVLEKKSCKNPGMKLIVKFSGKCSGKKANDTAEIESNETSHTIPQLALTWDIDILDVQNYWVVLERMLTKVEDKFCLFQRVFGCCTL